MFHLCFFFLIETATYSNLDNHPALIADPAKKINLSAKTGLPKGIMSVKAAPATKTTAP
jgi:hypothetical protein